VAKLRTQKDWSAVKAYVKEAYESSLQLACGRRSNTTALEASGTQA
jgi:hypothetical protein